MKTIKAAGLVQDTETNMLQITKRKLNNNQHNVIRLRFSTEEIFITSMNYGLELGANFTERFIDPRNKNKGKEFRLAISPNCIFLLNNPYFGEIIYMALYVKTLFPSFYMVFTRLKASYKMVLPKYGLVKIH